MKFLFRGMSLKVHGTMRDIGISPNVKLCSVLALDSGEIIEPLIVLSVPIISDSGRPGSAGVLSFQCVEIV